MIRFPIDCLISVVAAFLDGSVREVGMIGYEGLSGAAELLSQAPAIYDSYVRIAGSCLEMNASIFLANVNIDIALRHALDRYAYAAHGATAQMAACNGTHSIAGRSAKWILLAHDRVAGDVIGLTHEIIGKVLDVRRAGVSVAAMHLKKLGAINYSHGKITVASRELLEHFACECYRLTNDHSAAILGYDIRKALFD